VAERAPDPKSLGSGCFQAPRHLPPAAPLPFPAILVPLDALAGFKARLDRALSTLGWWKGSLLMAGGLEPDDL